MGKQGPCYHCGVTSTPLWRNGPPDKPVLCNACGSRWRTKGTLVNYTPLHARAEPDGTYDDHRYSRLKSISVNKIKEAKLFKRKMNHDNNYLLVGVTGYENHQGYRKFVDEDTSNRSSYGSAISNSESCAQFGSQDASDLTGPSQSNVWDTMVPSKKRTCVSHSKPSPVEKLTKDLCTILHEQQSSYFSGTSEEDLLFESETPMVSVEIGHGSVLIRHPSTIAREEESEASSLSVENKQYVTNEAFSHPLTVPVHKGIGYISPAIGKAKNPFGQRMHQEQFKRAKSQNEKLQVLASHNSLLCNIDLSDIVNYEEFARNFTYEEQQQLLKYLPPLDVAKLPDSIKSMFNSLQFKVDLSSFQQLLGEGVFDFSFPGAKTEDCKTLKRLALVNLMKSKWVGHHNLLKNCKSSARGSVPTTALNTIATAHVVNGKRPRDNHNQNYPEENNMMRSPRRVSMKEIVDDDGSCYSPKSIFALPPDGTSLMLDNFHFVGDSSDQDLLLDVPSNNSFPQAELLHPNIAFGQHASTSSSSVNPHLVYP